MSFFCKNSISFPHVPFIIPCVASYSWMVILTHIFFGAWLAAIKRANNEQKMRRNFVMF